MDFEAQISANTLNDYCHEHEIDSLEKLCQECIRLGLVDKDKLKILGQIKKKYKPRKLQKYINQCYDMPGKPLNKQIEAIYACIEALQNNPS